MKHPNTGEFADRDVECVMRYAQIRANDERVKMLVWRGSDGRYSATRYDPEYNVNVHAIVNPERSK